MTSQLIGESRSSFEQFHSIGAARHRKVSKSLSSLCGAAGVDGPGEAHRVLHHFSGCFLLLMEQEVSAVVWFLAGAGAGASSASTRGHGSILKETSHTAVRSSTTAEEHQMCMTSASGSPQRSFGKYESHLVVERRAVTFRRSETPEDEGTMFELFTSYS